MEVRYDADRLSLKMNVPIKNKCAPGGFGAVVGSPLFLILVSKILRIYQMPVFFFKSAESCLKTTFRFMILTL